MLKSYNQTLATYLNKCTEFNKLLKIIKTSKQEFYIVGGAVRNSLLNQEITDIDIASSFTPQENIKLLAQHNIKTLTYGIKFGTVIAVIKNKHFEITSFRKDIKQQGRYTKVIYSNNIKTDAKRRDFTYNALYYCPIKHTIYDFFNGELHLKNKQTVFIGDAKQRIKEDFLRILRYFRFASIYGNGTFDSNIVDICKKESKNLKILSKERITQEIIKICSSKNVANTLFTLSSNKILQHILKLSFSIKEQKQLQNLLQYVEETNIKHNKEIIVLIFLQIINSLNINTLAIDNKTKQNIKATICIFNNLKITSKQENIQLLLEENSYNNIITALLFKTFFTKENYFLQIAKQLPLTNNFPFNGSIFVNKNIKAKYIKNALYDLKLLYLKGNYTNNTIQNIIKEYQNK